MDDGTPADKHLRKIAIHVSAYITHVRTQLKQTIPKAIVHTLVRPLSLKQQVQKGCSSSYLHALTALNGTLAEQAFTHTTARSFLKKLADPF